jgi:hemerythrin
MMAIVWTKKLMIGIDVIDNQHRQLVDYINELEGVARDDRASVLAILHKLIDYTISHFAFEESLQNEAGYIFAAPHKGMHDKFIHEINWYRDRHYAGELIADKLHQMLCTWMVRHIQCDDRDYVADVKDNMVKILKNRNEAGWFGRTLKSFFDS